MKAQTSQQPPRSSPASPSPAAASVIMPAGPRPKLQLSGYNYWIPFQSRDRTMGVEQMVTALAAHLLPLSSSSGKNIKNNKNTSRNTSRFRPLPGNLSHSSSSSSSSSSRSPSSSGVVVEKEKKEEEDRRGTGKNDDDGDDDDDQQDDHFLIYIGTPRLGRPPIPSTSSSSSSAAAAAAAWSRAEINSKLLEDRNRWIRTLFHLTLQQQQPTTTPIINRSSSSSSSSLSSPSTHTSTHSSVSHHHHQQQRTNPLSRFLFLDWYGLADPAWAVRIEDPADLHHFGCYWETSCSFPPTTVVAGSSASNTNHHHHRHPSGAGVGRSSNTATGDDSTPNYGEKGNEDSELPTSSRETTSSSSATSHNKRCTSEQRLKGMEEVPSGLWTQSYGGCVDSVNYNVWQLAINQLMAAIAPLHKEEAVP